MKVTIIPDSEPISTAPCNVCMDPVPMGSAIEVPVDKEPVRMMIINGVWAPLPYMEYVCSESCKDFLVNYLSKQKLTATAVQQ